MAQSSVAILSQVSDISNAAPVIQRISPKDYNNVLDIREKLGEDNWAIWRELFMHTIDLFLGALALLQGLLTKPDSVRFPAEANTWEANNKWLGLLIVQNLEHMQHIHIKCLNNARAMWVALEAVHKPKGHLTVVNIEHILFYSKAEEGDDLVEHTNKLKTYWEQVNAFEIPGYNISDVQFKGIITGSLPSSWDSFTAPYSNQYKNLGSNNE